MSDQPPFDFNCPRIPIDCILKVTERATGKGTTVYLGGNCKTETCYTKDGFWMFPNADFVPLYTEDEFMILKAYDRCGKTVLLGEGKVQPDRQIGSNAEAYAKPLRFVAKPIPARRLATAQEVVQAGMDCRPLMSRTRFGNDRYDAVLEYPLKTVNLNDRHGVFQPDTGPVLFPNLNVEPDELFSTLEMAFVAWNAYPGSATGDLGVSEFLVRTPTEIVEKSESQGQVSVLHYSKSVRMQASHMVFAID